MCRERGETHFRKNAEPADGEENAIRKAKELVEGLSRRGHEGEGT